MTIPAYWLAVAASAALFLGALGTLLAAKRLHTDTAALLDEIEAALDDEETTP